jgi:DNA-binding transcriptional regulator YbjK
MENRQPRLERAEEAVQSIIIAATNELLEEGLESITHRRIAERANANLRSTTYYFKSVKALRREALKLAFGITKKSREAALANLPSKKLSDVVDLLLLMTYGATSLTLKSLAITLQNVSMASADPDYDDVMQQLQVDVEDAVTRLFAHFNFDYPAQRAIALVDGRIFEYVLSGGKTSIKDRLHDDLGI